MKKHSRRVEQLSKGGKNKVGKWSDGTWKADIQKELKFTPEWLLHGSWDWLIYYDAACFLSPQNLLPFLQQREHMALVLHDYCYFYKESCGEGNGFKCFEHDMDF